MAEELYQFLACDYYATGEGRSIMLLITRAYPHADDYETPGDYNLETKVYTPPVLKKGMTDKVRAAREFAEQFGGYYLQGAENLPREEFIRKYKSYLPEYVLNFLDSEEQPGNFNFKQSVHFNFA